MNAVKNVQKQLDNLVKPLEKTKQPIANMNAEFEKMNLASKKVVKEVENVGKSITRTLDMGRGKIAQVTQGMDGSVNKIKLINNGFKGIGDILTHNIKKFAEWTFAAGSFFMIINGIKNAFRTMVSLESEAVNIAKVLPENVALRPFEERAIKLAKQYGQSVIDVEKATANWAKQYKNVQDVAIATQASLLAATATDIGFEQSVKSLSAIIAEWNLEAKDSIHIVDMLNEVSNNYRVTAEGVAEALAKSGSGAKALGMTMEQLTGIVTTGIQALGMEGSQVGTFWTRTMARMRGNDSAIAAIQKLGIDAMQPLSTLMDEIAAKWDLMTSGEKQNFAITVAGTQHWSRFTGIMDNYNTVIEATSKSYNSMNSAQQEVDRVMQTTAKHIEQLNAQWQEYIYRNSEVLKVTKNIVDVLSTLIAGLAQFNPLIVVAGVVALTFAFQGLFAAIMSTTTAFSVATVGLLSNPWTAPIAAITAVAGALLLVGNNANKAQNEVLKMQTELANFEHYNSGIINQSRGIIDLANKYEIFQRAIEKAKKAGQDYSTLTDKFNVAQSELAKAVGVSNAELELMIKKDGNIKKFVENRLHENAALINSERDKANEIKKATKARLEEQLKPYQDKIARYQALLQRQYPNLNTAVRNQDVGAQIQIKENIALFNKAINQTQAKMKPILDEINKIKIDTRKTTVQDFYHQADDGVGKLKEEQLKDRIQPILTDLDSATLTRIETIGRSWQDNINKALTAAGVKPEGLLQDDKAIYVLKDTSGLLAQETTINKQLRDALMKPFEEMDKAAQELQKAKDKITFDEEKTKAAGKWTSDDEFKKQQNIAKAYETYRVKLEEQYEVLEAIQNQLDSSSDGFKLLGSILDQLGLKIKKVGEAAKSPQVKYEENQIKMINSMFDALSTALVNMGDTMTDVAAVITRAFADNFGSDGLNTEGFKGGVASGLFTMFIDGWIKGMNKQRIPMVEKYQPERYDVTSARLERLAQSDREKKIAKLWDKIHDHPIVGKRYRAGKKKMGPFQDWFDDIMNDIRKLENAIAQSIDGWAKAVGSGINDITQYLEDAFQSSNAMEFLQNWNQSLYEMTRTALIRGFMAQEAFSNLYRNLSQTIAMAVVDGQLSTKELSNIQIQGDRLGQKLQVLYRVLNGLEGAFGVTPGSSGGEQNYQAGSSVPITYNNYITIQSMAFAGNEDEAREFALLLNRYVIAEQGRG